MEIIASNIKLRDWISDDIEVYKYWLEPQHEWHNLDGPYYKITLLQADQTIIELSRLIHNNSFPEPRTRLVIADNKSNTLIGIVSSYWQSKETNWLSAGISIYDPAYWGKGVGYEALQIWITYLFSSYPKIVRLDFRTWSGNKGMMKLAEKLGFKLEACFRNARIVDEKYFDGLAYGILRSEWENN
jgi:RimJ/RimL family protein N-acetyltransferase